MIIAIEFPKIGCFTDILIAYKDITGDKLKTYEKLSKKIDGKKHFAE